MGGAVGAGPVGGGWGLGCGRGVGEACGIVGRVWAGPVGTVGKAAWAGSVGIVGPAGLWAGLWPVGLWAGPVGGACGWGQEDRLSCTVGLEAVAQRPEGDCSGRGGRRP